MANAHSRTTIFDSGDFRLHAQLAPVSSPHDGHVFTSQRQESRNPHEEHVKFLACLDRKGLEGVSKLFNLAISQQDSKTAASIRSDSRP